MGFLFTATLRRKNRGSEDLPKELYLEVDRRIAELRDKEKLSFPEIAGQAY